MRLFAPLFLVVGVALQAMALCMLVTALIGWYFHTGNSAEFAYSALFCVISGAVFFLTGLPHRSSHLLTRQMFLITGGTWLLIPLFASLPLLFATTHLSFTDAVFETVSGITTTGSTVLSGLDSIPPDILVWRSLLQWQGGVGIICMAVALLPFLRIGGMRLFQTESSHWSDDNAPRARKLVESILYVYVLLTCLCVLSYVLTGMPLFDAVNNAFTTISTGGFSTSDRSFSDASLLTQWVAVVFMLAGAVPFVLYLQLFRARFRDFFGDSQVFVLLCIVFSLALAVAANLWLYHQNSPLVALTRAAFNITSIITTTGFASDDYNHWGNFAIAAVFFATFVGGCSGSTSGGTKIFRLQLFFALLKEQLARAVHPKITRAVSYNGKQVKSELVTALVAYFFVMLLCLIVITLGLAWTDLDLLSSITGASTALMNVGPGLGDVIGPAGNFSTLTDFGKWLLCFGMLLGRLEFLTILILFTSSYWRG